MDYFKKNILHSLTNNTKQEEEAIQTLSNRLEHATLSADRRSAVLGLKSFSRQFRESVVEYGLRPLLQTLEKDVANVPTLKAVMETLIILFIRGGESEEEETLGWISNQSRIQNGKYPSPFFMKDIGVDQFSMWIADEVISCDDYIKAMVDTLQSNQDYHVRLYTLQFLEALVATRSTRSKECLINIPLAIPTIVSLLSDSNDPVRNETILLLMALVNDNFNIQKLVAFENTFDRLFEIIDEEGGIRGSILVQDCLTLVTNLLTYNASNQKFFLETDCVPKLAKLLAEPIESSLDEDELASMPAAPIVWTDQRLQNMAIALEICKSFVDEDNISREQNQNRLHQAGIFFSVLRLTFSPVTESPIRKTALEVTGDLIAGNNDLQLEFSRIDVPYIDPSLPTQVQRYDKFIPAPLALLNWCLLSNSVHIFDIRLASAYCLRSLFMENSEAKIAFVTDQIKASHNPNFYYELAKDGEGIESPEKNENIASTPYANIFTTLMSFDFEAKLNPYRIWFASVILIYLFEDCPENRESARKLRVGNSDEGEEVMISIQAISEILTTSLEYSDPRIAVGLLLLLTIWLFEDFEAVNDFLSDLTIIKSLLGFLSKNSTESSGLVHGMTAILVGIVYEFSRKSSPIPRSDLYSLVTKSLGADNYALKVKQFRDCEEFKSFTDPLQSNFEKDSTGLPKVFFIENYLELVKDNFHRIRKALSHDPLVEPQLRVSYEAFEEMQNKLAQLTHELKEVNEKSAANEKYLKQKILDAEEELNTSRMLIEKSTSQLDQLRELESILTEKIEKLASDLKLVEEERESFEDNYIKCAEQLDEVRKLNVSDKELISELTQKLESLEAEKKRAEEGINKMSRELFLLTKQKKESSSTISILEKRLESIQASKEKLEDNYRIQFEALKKTTENYKAKVQIIEGQLKELSNDRDRKAFKIRESQERLSEAESNNISLMEKLRTAAVLVQNLRRANPDIKEDKTVIQSSILQSQEEFKTVRVLEEEITQQREKIHELEFLIQQTKDSAAREETNLRNEISALSDERANQTEKERRLSDELNKAIMSLAEAEENFHREKISLQEEVQTLGLEKDQLQEKMKKSEAEHELEKKRLQDAMKTLKEDMLQKEKLLREELLSKSKEFDGLKRELNNQLEVSSSLKRQLERQIKKYDEFSIKATSERDSLVEKNRALLADVESLQEEFKRSLSNSKDTIRQLEEQVRRLSEENELSASSKVIIEKHEEMELQLQQQIRAKDAEINRLEETIQKAIAEQETTVSQFETRITDLTESNSKEVENLKIEIEKITSERETLMEQLSKSKEIGKNVFLTEKQEFLKQLEAEQNKLSIVLNEKQAARELIERYEHTITENQKQIAEQTLLLDEKDKEIRDQVEKLKHDEELFFAEKSALNIRIAELNDQKVSLETKMIETKELKADLDEQIRNIATAKTELERDLQRSWTDILQLEAEMKLKDEHIEELKSIIDSEKEKKQKEMIALKIEATGNDGATRDALTKEITNKINELVAKDKLIFEIEKKLEESTIALEDLTGQNDLLKLQKNKLEIDLKNTQKELKQLTKQLSRLEKELEWRRKIEPNDPENNFSVYKIQISELESSLEKTEDTYRNEMEKLQESYTSKVSELQSESNKFKNECAQLAEDIASLETKNQELKNECRKMATERKAHDVGQNDKGSQYSDRDSEIKGLQSEIETLNSTVASLRVELHAREEEYRMAKNELQGVEAQLSELSLDHPIHKKMPDASQREGDSMLPSLWPKSKEEVLSLQDDHGVLDLDSVSKDKTQAEISSLNDKESNLEHETDMYEELRKKIKELELREHCLDDQVKMKEEQIAKFKVENDILKEELSEEVENKCKSSELERQVEILKSEIAMREERIQGLKSQVNRSTETISERENHITATGNTDENQLKLLQVECEDLKEELKYKSEIVTLIEKEKSEVERQLKELQQVLSTKDDTKRTEALANEDNKENGQSMIPEQVTKLKSEVEELHEKLEREHELRSQAESELETLRIERRKEKEAIAREEELKKKVEADFEDMMLMWEEQEKKIELFKQRLRDCGQEVSSDEE